MHQPSGHGHERLHPPIDSNLHFGSSTESTSATISLPGRGQATTPARPRPTGHLVWARSFSGTPDQVAQARRLVRFLLTDTPCADDAELIVSELAGNALRHSRSGDAGGSFTVEVVLGRASFMRHGGEATGILITVHDQGGNGVPWFRGEHPPDTNEENGRGLATVAALATRVGYQGGPTVGHRVWAYLSTREDLATPPGID